MSRRPLRLMVYDRTCTGRGALPGLTHSWMAGALLYRGLGRLDAWRGVASWEEAFAWLADVRLEQSISEIQFWGHGKWGEARVDGEILDDGALTSASPFAPYLRRIRARLASEESLWWFRTCETFGAKRGQAFARAWTDHFGCAAAGHTYIIGPWQSGLHRLAVGAACDWSDDEGIAEGDADEPKRAFWSTRKAPNTISCLHGEVPEGF